MTLFKEASALTAYLNERKKQGKSIGFVPTMGALHAGHISLIDKSRIKSNITVASIFVNPTQFNDLKDFEKYPVTIGADIQKLEAAGCDILFLPSVSEMYPNGTNTLPYYDLGEIENLLEGKYRPGHFQGVCQVVHRLLQIVKPDFLFMGQKDYQQCMVVEKLIKIADLDIQLVKVDTYREATGLAMSSRNLRLDNLQKKEATAISKSLHYIKENYSTKPFDELENCAKDYLLNHGFSKVDYVSIADAETLQPANTISSKVKLVALVAATIGEIRLIDNMILNH